MSIDVEKVKQDFIDSRIASNELHNTDYDENPPFMTIRFDNADCEGVVVIDSNSFFKLPKSKQNKILKRLKAG